MLRGGGGGGDQGTLIPSMSCVRNTYNIPQFQWNLLSRLAKGVTPLSYICPGKGPVTGSCEHGSESLGSIKGGEFLNWLSDF
jgi:hypothetical protein